MRLRRGFVRCSLAAVLFGASTPLVSVVAGDVGAPVLAGLLYLGAGGAMLPVASRGLSTAGVRLSGRRLVVAVAAGGLVGPVLLAAGLARTPAASASLLLNFELVATVLLAAGLFGEYIGRRVRLGTALVVLGGFLVAWGGTPELRFGAVLVVGACFCWGLDNCVTSTLAGLSPAQVTLTKGLVAGSANLAIGLALGEALPDAATVAYIVAVGALGYGLSITLWVGGARELGAARAQLVFSSAPFVGVAVAWLVLADPVTAAQVAAMALGALGVLCVVGSGHEHPHLHPRVEHVHAHRHDDSHHLHPHDQPTASGHTHPHEHPRLVHAHRHLPDLEHRHPHHDRVN